MSHSSSRRDALKALGVASAGALLPIAPLAAAAVPSPGEPPSAPPPLRPLVHHAPGDLVDLVNTSDVFTPARGNSYMRFSFDFPEPGVVFGGHRFSILLFTEENTYALDRAGMRATGNDEELLLSCDGLTWAGGQEKAPGTVTVVFRKRGRTITWDITAQMERPIKTVTTVVRDIPRGRVSLGGSALMDGKEGDFLGGYPFSAGDLHGGETPQSMSTPVAVIEAAGDDFVYLTTHDTQVRPKRYYLQAGERMYRTECIYEHDAWRNDTRITVPRWELGHAPSLDAALDAHMAIVERAFALEPWATRADAPAWMRDLSLVLTMHGMHYTGFVFNSYARQLEILRWVATQIDPRRVLVFLASWDGRYYWDYPNYVVPQRMGGEQGFRTLVSEARQLGFRMMPMFGTNSANRKQPNWDKLKRGATYKIDGDLYNLNWVDWNNDRHQDGWLTYMNLGEDRWRRHMESRIAETIERFQVDAYFLDIVGGHVNSTTGDMHDGTRRLIANLRAQYPQVVGVGEMPYDALHAFIPLFHAGNGERWRKYSRFYSHLSAPAPGRGSSGVHEAGFQRFNTDTLGLNPNAIPTLQIVDDTFTKHRDVMARVIAAAKLRGTT